MKTEHKQNLTRIAHAHLCLINGFLAEGFGAVLKGKQHSIDEIVILDESFEPVFMLTKYDRKVEIGNLMTLIRHFHAGCKLGENSMLLTLKGQEAEDFDFLISEQGGKYYMFGNFLGGTLEDLEENPVWESIILPEIVNMSNALIHLIHLFSRKDRL